MLTFFLRNRTITLNLEYENMKILVEKVDVLDTFFQILSDRSKLRSSGLIYLKFYLAAERGEFTLKNVFLGGRLGYWVEDLDTIGGCFEQGIN